jgi:hypothetical protein
VNAGTSHRFSLQRVTQLGLFVVLVVLIVGPLAVLLRHELQPEGTLPFQDIGADLGEYRDCSPAPRHSD